MADSVSSDDVVSPCLTFSTPLDLSSNISQISPRLAFSCPDFSTNISEISPGLAKPVFYPTPQEDLSSNNTTSSLETYLTTLHSSSSDNITVYWIHDDPQDKIRCAFQNLQLDSSFGGLIQFWAPVGGCGRRLLTTSDQPFILGNDYPEDGEYRLCSLKYRYCVGVVEEEDVGIITDGAAATAFLNQTPELFPDLKAVDQSNPLLYSAKNRYMMMSCVMVPVFDPAQSCWVGVVECSTNPCTEFLEVFSELNTALEKEGLKTFDARDRLPYKTIRGLEHAKNEIDDALKIISHTHGIGFADVWIAYKDENQVSLEDGQAKSVIGLKLTDYYSVIVDDEDSKEREYYFRIYHNACYRLPLKMEEGLIGKTFQNHKPYFVENISELTDSDSVLELLSYNCDFNRFVIYLRSTKTSDLDYVFEFLWMKSRDNVILLESLLLTFKRYLPSFKFASGIELGEKIDILDVKNSKGSENKYMKIFQRKASLKRGRQSKLEECSTPLESKGKTAETNLSREQIESQFGQRQKDFALELGVDVSMLKRKCVKYGIKWQGRDRDAENESDTNEEKDNGGAIQDNTGEASLDKKNMVIVKAEYADDVIMFTHPISLATSKAMEKEIVKRFELDPATRYKLKYLDVENNEWILFTCDEDVTLFQKDKRNIRLRLLTRDPSHT